MTSKKFLYSVSVLALALQVCVSSPSLAMEDKDKEGGSKISPSLTLSPEKQLEQATAHVRKECNYLKTMENQLAEKKKEITSLFPNLKEDQYFSLADYAKEGINSNNPKAYYFTLLKAQHLLSDFDSKRTLYQRTRSVLEPLAKIFGITTLGQYPSFSLFDFHDLYTPIEMLKFAFENFEKTTTEQSSKNSSSVSKSASTPSSSTSSSSSSSSSSSITSSPLSPFVSPSTTSKATVTVSSSQIIQLSDEDLKRRQELEARAAKGDESALRELVMDAAVDEDLEYIKKQAANKNKFAIKVLERIKEGKTRVPCPFDDDNDFDLFYPSIFSISSPNLLTLEEPLKTKEHPIELKITRHSSLFKFSLPDGSEVHVNSSNQVWLQTKEQSYPATTWQDYASAHRLNFRIKVVEGNSDSVELLVPRGTKPFSFFGESEVAVDSKGAWVKEKNGPGYYATSFEAFAKKTSLPATVMFVDSVSSSSSSSSASSSSSLSSSSR
jgi:hypothetical protein